MGNKKQPSRGGSNVWGTAEKGIGRTCTRACCQESDRRSKEGSVEVTWQRKTERITAPRGCSGRLPVEEKGEGHRGKRKGEK